jgi:hypothetical protein
MEASQFPRKVQYHPILVVETDHRQLLVKAYFEKYYGCELNKILGKKHRGPLKS